MRWDDMQGDARARFCASCRLHVYDLSEMSRKEAERLVFKTEGRVCVRFFRRDDGTILTRDCPVGLAAARARLARLAAFLVGLVATSLGLSSCRGSKKPSEALGERVQMNRTMGLIAPPQKGQPLMGDVAPPAPKP